MGKVELLISRETIMAIATLEQIRPLVDQLSLHDQARLLEYLTPRVTRAVVSDPAELVAQPTLDVEALPPAWQALFCLGDELGQQENISNISMTTAVVSSRR